MAAACGSTLWIICGMSHVERSRKTNLQCDICTMLTKLYIKEQLNVLLVAMWANKLTNARGA